MRFLTRSLIGCFIIIVLITVSAPVPVKISKADCSSFDCTMCRIKVENESVKKCASGYRCVCYVGFNGIAVKTCHLHDKNDCTILYGMNYSQDDCTSTGNGRRWECECVAKDKQGNHSCVTQKPPCDCLQTGGQLILIGGPNNWQKCQ